MTSHDKSPEFIMKNHQKSQKKSPNVMKNHHVKMITKNPEVRSPKVMVNDSF